MFRFFSLLPIFTMRRLLFFLVFAAIGATNPVEDFDEWDFRNDKTLYELLMDLTRFQVLRLHLSRR